MQEFEASGSFWLPERPDNIFWGTLKFSPGRGINLILEGDLPGYDGPIPSVDYPALNGRLFNGAQCTLISPSATVEAYHADKQYLRTHVTAKLLVPGTFSTQEACKFKSFQVRFTHLDSWFEPAFDLQRTPGNFDKAQIDFKPDKLSADFVFRGVCCKLVASCSTSAPFLAWSTELTWQFAYYLSIEPEEEQEVGWYLDVATELRALFVFLVGSGVFTVDLVGMMWHAESGRDVPFQLWYPTAVPRSLRLEHRYYSTHLKDYRETMPAVVREWFKSLERLRVASSCYSELLCADGIAGSTILLRTMQTLEHMHGVIFGEDARYVKRATFRKLIGTMRNNFPFSLEGVPEDEMVKLKSSQEIILSRIGNLNEFSFRSRIEKIVGSIPESELYPIFRNPRDINRAIQEFVTKVEASRHYLSHYDQEQKGKAFPSEEIEEAALTCWAVLTFWVAKMLGFNDDQSGRIASQAREALFLVQPQFRL